MLFGKSLFQSVVDRLADEEEDEVEVPEPSFRVSGLSTSFATEKIEASPVNAGLRQDAYLFLMSQGEPVETKAPIKPPHLERLTVEQIAEDLQLQDHDSRDVLQERRRLFAKHNHPDTVHTDFREPANTRMKIANLLIDEAMRRLDTVA
ncbi:hypothetical protein PDO_1742 [Rhizobium sp. PDO1-076]|uniref:hypothetical protein n=1 Tax=Rhizobium sp. PDO1-076 TaxID=1125979 RepID=UPI00024E2B19|nr:hypothetical protein [Rhizobium sp. PDO1-076]EHS51718.1 hypothetical protein PDO_1742 [Rhizobium sp. PDO1-076]